MTIGQIIGLIRGPLKMYSDDSVNISDEHFYIAFIASYSTLLSRKINLHQIVPSYISQSYCIPMIEDTIHGCDCYDIGCKVMKSSIKLPKTINGRLSRMRIKNFSGTEIFLIDINELKSVKQDRIKQNQKLASIYNGYIVIHNADYDAIIVEDIFADPTEFEKCTADCTSMLDTIYPGDPEIISAAIDITIQKYLPKINPDKQNG